jgi:hypothetical protein
MVYTLQQINISIFYALVYFNYYIVKKLIYFNDLNFILTIIPIITMYQIEQIELSDVKLNDKIKYNSNNHWIDDVRPKDYIETNKLTETKNWVNLFKKMFITINLDSSDLSMLKTMRNVCLLKYSIPALYRDEMEYLINKYNCIDDYLSINGGHFVRCENVSLKCGMHGCIPYTTFKQILESILTADIGHSPLYETLQVLRIYLIPWVPIHKFKEWRVFVYKNQITAISQQHLYESNKLLSDLEPEDRDQLIHGWIRIITDYFNTQVKEKILSMSNYVYDFAIGEDIKPYFIEINPFGKEYSSGSSLFHWLIDESKLYNMDGTIFFRYCV